MAKRRKSLMNETLTKHFVIVAMLIATIVTGADLSAKLQNTNTFEQFIFVDFNAGGAGPMPVSPVNRFMKVSVGNYGQIYKVANSPIGDQIVSFEEKKVRAEKLFDYISSAFSKLPGKAIEPPNNNLIADEYVPASVQLTIQMPDGKTYNWEGPEARLPNELKDLIKLAEDTIQSGQTIPSEKPFAYLAAYWLDEHAAVEFKREGMIHAIGTGTNSLNPLALETLQHPFQLIPLKQETNPFMPYQRFFRPGLETLEVSYSRKNYQIRSIAVTTNSNMGDKNEKR